MLVNAQADSNCSIVLSLWLRNSTSLMKRMKRLLQNVKKPGQDSQVDHHVDWRVPLTAQDLSRGLGGLRRESGWKRIKQGGTQKECKIPANNLKLLVTILTLDAILYLFDGEQGRLLVLLQGAEKRRFTRHMI